jgi:predicted DCC family thiol-disulfide oxidoreductase YuxK
MTTLSAPIPHAESGPAPAQKALVLYDGACPLCRKSVRLLRGLDWFNALAFADVRDAGQVPDLPAPVPRRRLLEEMHLLTPGGGHVYHGFAAFRWMAWRLPLLWAVAPLLYLPGMPALGQRLYLWVARNRFRLVPCHGGVCTLPGR